ncbi:MAG: CHC2 zinc finger domain-containing protein [Albidovulum sp.]|nr:CHC2 zinc finger domain-containing protein [Albidovulum sp.]
MPGPASDPDAASWARFKSRVKTALPLQETIQRVSGAKFEPTGQSFKACCPFHSEKTPSFIVNAEFNTYRCFGAGCGAKGDVFRFLGDWYGISFGQAVKRAGELAGIEPPSPGDTDHSEGTRSPPQDAWRICRQSPPSPFVPNPNPEREFSADLYLRPIPAQVEAPKPGGSLQIVDPEKRRKYFVSPSMVHAYRQPGGEARLFVLRVEKAAGGKFFLQVCDPATSSKGGTAWKLIRFPAKSLRPLYGLEDLPAWEKLGSGKILLVEGEKTRDAASRLLPLQDTGILALSNFGGGSCGAYVEWKPAVEAARRLSESGTPIDIKIWPDADPPILRADGSTYDRQDRFARSLALSFLDSVRKSGDFPGEVRISRVAPADQSSPGWDLADAEVQEWTTGRVVDALEKCEFVAVPGASTALRGAGGAPLNRTEQAIRSGDSAPIAANGYFELEI